MLLFQSSLLLLVGSLGSITASSSPLLSEEAFGLRGSFQEQEGFECTIAGAGGQPSCDAATASDGTGCVWCSLSTLGFCVSATQAQQMKSQIPGLSCDDDDKVDDDAAPAPDDDAAPTPDDDAAPPPPDDDKTPDDDRVVPDDYWTCLKDYKTVKDCAGAGCVWCNGKTGYGVCMDKAAAEQANKTDFFTCEVSITFGVDADLSLSDPFDTTCLAASLSGDEAACKATMDSEGQPCEWCALSGGQANLCLNAEQASLAEQTGADCSTGSVDGSKIKENDPYDTSCLAASLEGDVASCEATKDADGQACEWCSLQSGQVNLCLTSEQAGIAEQVGADCKAAGDEVKDQDPYDTSCLAASLQGDEAACEATTDADGKACEWCSLQSGQVNLCLTSEQAGIAEQIGADCGKDTSKEVVLLGDEDEVGQCPLLECLKNLDSSECGSNSCTWCVAKCGHGLCLDPKSVETIGNCPFFDCKGDVDVSMTPGETGLRKSATSQFTKVAVHEPFDPQCLTAGMTPPGSDGAEETCRGTNDTSGQPCVWCDAAGVFGLCMSAEQASVAGEWLQCDGTASIENTEAVAVA